jgi:hypothetical protein
VATGAPATDRSISIPENREVVVKRRICLVGAALSVALLAFGVTSAAAKTSKPTKPTTKGTPVTCTTNVGVMIAPGDTGVTPPVDQGAEYGPVSCQKVGTGVQADVFTVPDSGDTLASYTWYFKTGTLHGKFDLTPQQGNFNGDFLEVDYLGTLTVTGGTGAWAGTKGTGTMTCTTLDGIHTSCRDKLRLQFPTVI